MKKVKIHSKRRLCIFHHSRTRKTNLRFKKFMVPEAIDKTTWGKQQKPLSKKTQSKE